MVLELIWVESFPVGFTYYALMTKSFRTWLSNTMKINGQTLKVSESLNLIWIICLAVARNL